jgi:hypothetical protein
MRRNILGVTAVAIAMLGTTITPAGAGPWTGVCALRVTIQFRQPMRAPLSNGAYDLDIASLADADPTKAGSQACAATLAGEPTTGTYVSGTGHASVWSCAAAVGGGTWHQEFDPEGPAGFFGSHTLGGSWGAWTLQVSNPSLSVVGVGEFTLQAVEATKTPSCGTGELDSVTMVGALVFQDP